MSRRRYLQRKTDRFMIAHPRLGLELMTLRGRVRWRLNVGTARVRTTAPADWRALLGTAASREARELSMEQAAELSRNGFFWRLQKRASEEQLAKLVEWRHLERITELQRRGRPVLIAGWHMGPWFALPQGLRTLGGPLTLVVERRGVGAVPPGWTLIATNEEQDGGVAAFRQATRELRQGGIVAMVCDRIAAPGEGWPIRVAGRELQIKRGFAAMARTGGAAVVPLAMYWGRGSRLMFEALPPLESAEGDRMDRETYERGVVWEYGERLDAYLRARPFDLEPRRVQNLLKYGKDIEDGERDRSVTGGDGNREGICR